jgi:hypothetical protein
MEHGMKGLSQVAEFMKANQTRTVRVLVALTASMTIGGFVLMALDDHGPARGAYSLASYLRLDPIQKVTMDSIHARKSTWNSIEVYYSHTSQGDLKQMFSQGRTGFHFLVCNGKGAEDGQIDYTSSWSGQKYVAASDGTIRICVIADRGSNPTTGSQLKRTSALVDSLSRGFNIAAEKIRYPADWQL